MNRPFSRIGSLLIMILVGVLMAAPGCGKKPRPSTDVSQETTQPDDSSGTTVEPGDSGDNQDEAAGKSLSDVFFDYDRYNLREDTRRVLEVDARVLLDNPEINATLEGHCDERGTVEYNLALGERRAQSVKDYLIEFGIDAGRLTAVSYGEERPFAEGHDETAWSQNRRVHFVKR